MQRPVGRHNCPSLAGLGRTRGVATRPERINSRFSRCLIDLFVGWFQSRRNASEQVIHSRGDVATAALAAKHSNVAGAMRDDVDNLDERAGPSDVGGEEPRKDTGVIGLDCASHGLRVHSVSHRFFVGVVMTRCERWALRTDTHLVRRIGDVVRIVWQQRFGDWFTSVL